MGSLELSLREANSSCCQESIWSQTVIPYRVHNGTLKKYLTSVKEGRGKKQTFGLL